MTAEEPMTWGTHELESRLRDLGGALGGPAQAGELTAPPAAGDLAARVRTRIEAEAPRRAGASWWRPPLRRSVILALAALLIAAAAVTAAIGYGLPGIRILFGPPPSLLPSASAPPSGVPGATLGLGTTLTLEEAAALVDFEVVLPEGLGPPDAVYLAGSRLALAWGPGPGLPGTAHPGLGLLMVELRASVDAQWIEKLIRTGTQVEAVAVDGAPGYWIEGERHFLAYLAPDGTWIEDSIRGVGNTLLWGRDGVTYRLEGEFERGEAIALAGTLR